ncbi:MAG TPA: hypothetical protein VFV38_47425 [Ktedonobacteraceae bacterium]|nr:hypothetical protein [Ktedonobacteraceae bacterium]
MASIFALLVFFLVIGLFARSFNNRVRALLLVGIVGLLIYLYLT